MNCLHVPDNRLCEPCTRREYPDWKGIFYDFREGDRVWHSHFGRNLRITKIFGHGSLIMTQEGVTVGRAHLEPPRVAPKDWFPIGKKGGRMAYYLVGRPGARRLYPGEATLLRESRGRESYLYLMDMSGKLILEWGPWHTAGYRAAKCAPSIEKVDARDAVSMMSRWKKKVRA